MRLLILVDSLEYARANSYIHQLLLTCEREHETTVVPLTDVIFRRVDPKSFDRVLSCLKLRTLYHNCGPEGFGPVVKFLDGCPVYAYDQDPWECFSDQATYPGSYQHIAKHLNVKSFLNTSCWWSGFINAQGIPSKFVQMWALPEYCTSDPPWHARKIDVGFCGQLHPYRRALFERLEKAGVPVHHFTSGDYRHYLSCLSQTKIFVHSEQTNWSVNGVPTPGPMALWIKDVEACGRGCFSMREYDLEANAYGLGQISTMMPYHSFDELLDNIKSVLSREESEWSPTRETLESVEYIQTARGWKTVLDAMEIE